ncbi:MAG: DUF6092 family protein [Candidatus Fimivivens sp.]
MSEQDQQSCLELLVYMLSSATALGDEPKVYGALRLAEASCRLGGIMLNNDPENHSLKALVSLIENGKHQSMSDEADFYAMLQEATDKLVDFM